MKVIISQTDSFLTKDKTLAESIYNIVYEMCTNHSGHEFVWLSFDNNIPLPQAPFFTNMILKPPVLHQWRRHAWFNNELTSIIKAECPSFIINFNGKIAKTDLPQCTVIDGLDTEVADKPVSGVHIITFSDYVRQMLIKKGYNMENIYVIKPSVSGYFKPAEWEEREGIKERYARGTEYFLLPVKKVSGKQTLNILKAFSLFKKWQRSKTQLLIYSDESVDPDLKKLLLTYKFREDVIVCEVTGEKDRGLITASAISLLHFPETDDTGITVLESLQAHVPFITCDKGAIQEMAGDAAMYCNAEDVEEIADKMKKIYRDEKFRNQLNSRIVERASFHAENKPALYWWQVVEKAVSGK